MGGEGLEGGDEVAGASEVEEGEGVGGEFKCRSFAESVWLFDLAPIAQPAISVFGVVK